MHCESSAAPPRKCERRGSVDNRTIDPVRLALDAFRHLAAADDLAAVRNTLGLTLLGPTAALPHPRRCADRGIREGSDRRHTRRTRLGRAATACIIACSRCGRARPIPPVAPRPGHRRSAPQLLRRRPPAGPSLPESALGTPGAGPPGRFPAAHAAGITSQHEQALFHRSGFSSALPTPSEWRAGTTWRRRYALGRTGAAWRPPGRQWSGPSRA